MRLRVGFRGQEVGAPQITTNPSYYDTFSGSSIDTTRWFGGGMCEWNALEWVREIKNGGLRLALRNVGDTSSDSGLEFADTHLSFVNPSGIYSIVADVTLREFSGIVCPASYDQPTDAIVKLEGIFFNTGSLNPADDVVDDVYLWADPTIPGMMQVGNWLWGSGLALGTDMGYYPIGTPLTLTNVWDKVNHRFVSNVKIKGKPGPGVTVTVPYSVSDTAPPAVPLKRLIADVYSQNCASVHTFAQAEARFDNVMINVPPPPTH